MKRLNWLCVLLLTLVFVSCGDDPKKESPAPAVPPIAPTIPKTTPPGPQGDGQVQPPAIGGGGAPIQPGVGGGPAANTPTPPIAPPPVVQPPAQATAPTTQEVIAMTKLQLKAYLEGIPDPADLGKVLMAVDDPTRVAGLEVIDAATLKKALENITDVAKLRQGLINIDKPTLTIAVRVINESTLDVSLNNVDASTLKVALESMDIATLKVGMKRLKPETLKEALIKAKKIDEATFRVAWNHVDGSTQTAMSALRTPEADQNNSSNQVEDTLKQQLERKMAIGNKGNVELPEFTYDDQTHKLHFKAKLNAKHEYKYGVSLTVEATYSFSADLDLDSPGNAKFCANYNQAYLKVIGMNEICVTAKEIAMALRSAI